MKPNSTRRWQQQLTDAFKSISDLYTYLELEQNTPFSKTAQLNFPLRVPQSFAERMEKGNPNDPLLKQVLPLIQETQTVAGFGLDPVGDLNAMVETGVIHKYQGRALFINTGSCAIHCRYCFRRNFPYTDFQLGNQKQRQAVAYLQQHTDIHEVILSGGDPLLLADDKLAKLIQQLNTIPHLKRIRIHSRLPIVLPDRITDELMNALVQTNKDIIMVIHCNHTNELNLDVKRACEKMRDAHIMLLNQSVLLKGINDEVAQLGQLSEKLVSFGVMPYYLHLLDKAAGTAHFEVSKARAILLMRELQAHLSGYLIPKLVQEEAGERAKTQIDY
ncbi:MAG: EF-P beta-lysylation protein EpmB [Methylococcales bacterium]|nr:EF-P beta-lysylation protein EpmB [Methylococcales bacterium]